MIDETGGYTKDFKRDKHSKALVASNAGALNKFKREKTLAETVEVQTELINTLGKEMETLQAQMKKLLEQNKDGN